MGIVSSKNTERSLGAIYRFVCANYTNPEKTVQGSPIKASKNNSLISQSTPNGASPKHLVLDIGVEIQRDIDGIEMGVLENGIM